MSGRRVPPSNACRLFFWSTTIMVPVSIKGPLVAALFFSKHVTARKFMFALELLIATNDMAVE